jgi:hypothetical protein
VVSVLVAGGVHDSPVGGTEIVAAGELGHGAPDIFFDLGLDRASAVLLDRVERKFAAPLNDARRIGTRVDGALEDVLLPSVEEVAVATVT